MRIEFQLLSRSYPARQEPVARALRSMLYQQEGAVPADMCRLLAQLDQSLQRRQLRSR